MARRSAASTATSCLESASGLVGTVAFCAGGADGETGEVDGDPECRPLPQATSVEAAATARETATKLRTDTPISWRGCLPADQFLSVPIGRSRRDQCRLGEDGRWLKRTAATRPCFPALRAAPADSAKCTGVRVFADIEESKGMAPVASERYADADPPLVAWREP